ncbi:MAG: hypothetical protein ACKVS9_02925 [Phycisphaerae bacterium]
MPIVAPPRDASYVPIGYCPACGYPCDPGRCAECGREVKRPLRRDPRVGVGRLLRFGRTVAVTIVLLGGVGYGALAWAYRYAPSDAVSAVADAELWGLSSIAIDMISWRWAEFDRQSIAHVERIRAEIAATPDHSWAGDYREANSDFPDRLYVAPGGGMAEYWASLCGFAKRVGPDRMGTFVSDSGDELCFDELEFVWRTGITERITFAKFRWGARSCLINTNSIPSEDAAPVPLLGALHFIYFRVSEAHLPFVGTPELPDEWRRAFQTRWRLATITSVHIDPDETHDSDRKSFVVSCQVDVPVSRERTIIGLFADMPRAAVSPGTGEFDTLAYYAVVQAGESLVEPQIGWQFAYDWDDSAEEGEAEFVGSDSATAEANQATP